MARTALRRRTVAAAASPYRPAARSHEAGDGARRSASSPRGSPASGDVLPRARTRSR